jgi:hypothetical protein
MTRSAPRCRVIVRARGPGEGGHVDHDLVLVAKRLAERVLGVTPASRQPLFADGIPDLLERGDTGRLEFQDTDEVEPVRRFDRSRPGARLQRLERFGKGGPELALQLIDGEIAVLVLQQDRVAEQQ